MKNKENRPVYCHYIIYIIILTTLLISCDNQTKKIIKDVNSVNIIKIPIYSGAYQINEATDISKGSKTISYYIDMEYPALDIIQFYIKKFDEQELIVLNASENILDEWGSFIDGTGGKDQDVRQFSLRWTDKKKDVLIILLARYSKYLKENWTNKAWIVCQIMPYHDATRLNAFFDRIEKEGYSVEFMELLDKYRKPNGGEVDIEKALNDSPQNKLLQEYHNIIKEMQKR